MYEQAILWLRGAQPRCQRGDTHLVCVTNTVLPAVFRTLCCRFSVQTLCAGHCVGGILSEHTVGDTDLGNAVATKRLISFSLKAASLDLCRER